MESFGRGIETACDTVLIVVEPSMESLELAKKIQDMAQGLGIRRVRAILNKIEDPEQAEFMIERLCENDIRYLGALESSRRWRTVNLRGEPLTAEQDDGAVYAVAKNMLDEAQMPYRKQKERKEET